MTDERTTERTVGGFLEVLASDAPTPGGGAVAGVAGATGAALIEMVANLTMDKEGFAIVSERMREIATAAAAERLAFLDLADRDAHAFDGVMAAFRMPKDSDEQKAARSAAIQAGYLDAASVPLETLRRAVALMPTAIEVTAEGNPQAGSDGLSAAASLQCSALCAAANVEINVASLKDEAARYDMLDEVATLRGRAEQSLREAQTAFAMRISTS